MVPEDWGVGYKVVYLYMVNISQKYLRVFSIVVLQLLLLLITEIATSQPIFKKIIVTEKPIQVLSSVSSPDNTIISVGYFSDHDLDAVLFKTDSNGSVLWARQFHLDNNNIAFKNISITTSGSIFISGQTLYPNFDSTPVIICLDNDGNLRWSHSYKFEKSIYLSGQTATSDGGLVMVGETYIINKEGGTIETGFLMKVDANGSIKWSKMTKQSHEYYSSYLTNVVETKDSSLVSCGIGFQDFDSVRATLELLKVGKDGTSVTSASYEPPILMQYPYSLLSNSDGSVTLCGGVYTGWESLTLIIRFPDIDTVGWATQIFTPIEAIASSIVGGNHDETLGILPAWGLQDSFWVAFKLDSLGTLVKSSGFYHDGANPLTITRINNSNGIFHLLFTQSQKTPTNTTISAISSEFIGCGRRPASCTAKSRTLTLLQSAIIPTNFSVNSTNLIIEESSPHLSEVELCTNELVHNSYQPLLLMVSPNPVTMDLPMIITLPDIGNVCEVILRDLTGREVYRTHREAATSGEQIQIPTAGLASGVYTVELVDASSFANVWRGKVVIE